MARRHVAFFRNLNLGQRGSPTRNQLVDAFEEARATEVSPFQVNGTVVFRAAAPVRTLETVCSILTIETGWSDTAPVRPVRWVLDLVDATRDVGDHAEVSVFDLRTAFAAPLPWRPPGGRVTVVRADRRHAVSVNDQPRTSYATPAIESLLRLRVTSRGLSTMQRLADHLR